MEGEKKTKGFPVKVTSKNLKHGDRIIYISKDRENLFLQKGKIVFRKKEGRAKYIFIAEFDNNVRSKEKVSHLCDAKMGYGAFVKATEIRKIKKEKFSLENYQKFLAKLEKKEKGEAIKSENKIGEEVRVNT
jgi:transcription antitermination factor NusG